MASNKERIENLEANLNAVQTSLSRLEVRVADKFQHLEAMVSKMMELINNDGKFIGDRICLEEHVAMTTAEAERESLTAPVVNSTASNVYWFKNLNELVEFKEGHYFNFTTSWCGPCCLISPILTEMAKKLPNYIFSKVDVDELEIVASDRAVEAMPTSMFLKEGKIVDKVVGAKKDANLATSLIQNALVFCADIILYSATMSMGDDVAKYGTVRPAPKPPDSYNCDEKFTRRLQFGITTMNNSYRRLRHCHLQQNFEDKVLRSEGGNGRSYCSCVITVGMYCKLLDVG